MLKVYSINTKNTIQPQILLITSLHPTTESHYSLTLNSLKSLIISSTTKFSYTTTPSCRISLKSLRTKCFSCIDIKFDIRKTCSESIRRRIANNNCLARAILATQTIFSIPRHESLIFLYCSIATKIQSVSQVFLIS